MCCRESPVPNPPSQCSERNRVFKLSQSSPSDSPLPHAIGFTPLRKYAVPVLKPFSLISCVPLQLTDTSSYQLLCEQLPQRTLGTGIKVAFTEGILEVLKVTFREGLFSGLLALGFIHLRNY